jgi:serine/threonine protein kinase
MFGSDPEQRALVIKEFRREAALMQALGHHPNCSTFYLRTAPRRHRHQMLISETAPRHAVACFFGAVTVGSKLCLVTEWVKNGSVYDLLIKKVPTTTAIRQSCVHTLLTSRREQKAELPFEVIMKLARDAACGILHLHSENVRPPVDLQISLESERGAKTLCAVCAVRCAGDP